MTICGEIDCEGCLVKYTVDISCAKREELVHVYINTFE